MNNRDVESTALEAMRLKDEAMTASIVAKNAEHVLIGALMDAGMTECFSLNWTAVKRMMGHDGRPPKGVKYKK